MQAVNDGRRDPRPSLTRGAVQVRLNMEPGAPDGQRINATQVPAARLSGAVLLGRRDP